MRKYACDRDRTGTSDLWSAGLAHEPNLHAPVSPVFTEEAVRFYQKNGFQVVGDRQFSRMLQHSGG
jgi:hypothetical protein